MRATLTAVLEIGELAAIAYFLASGTFYLILLAAAALEMRRHRLVTRRESGWRLLSSNVAPRISILAPAYNEGAAIAESVRALLTLSYPNLEVVLIDDGSTDDTLSVVEREFELVPIHPVVHNRLPTRPVEALYRSRLKSGLVVVHKQNGGKADALNVGLNVATGELVCAMDADTLIEPEALLRIVRPFLLDDDVLAAGGTIRVANGSRVRAGRVVAPRAPRSLLPGVQAVEYLRAFLLGRLGWNRLGGNIVISGAFGLFRRDMLVEIGGYLEQTVGEDIELVARLRRRAIEMGVPDRVEFVPDPVAWTEVPETLATLGRQRDRWHRGLADVLWRHRACILNPRYGALGMVVLPYFVVFELAAPVIEAAGLLGLGVGVASGLLDPTFAGLFFLAAYGYGLVLAALTLVLEQLGDRRYERWQDRLLLIGWAVVESLGYRQLTVWWRLRGLVKFLRRRTDWGVMARKGFAVAPERSPAAKGRDASAGAPTKARR